MLRPFLFIGVGGSGGKTLRVIRHELQRTLAEHGWTRDLPAGWAFLHIDVPAAADGDDPDLPAQLPQEDYAGMAPAGITYTDIDAALAAGYGRTPAGDLVAGWRPQAEQVQVPVSMGAGQYRAVGRVITLANLKSGADRLAAELRQLNGLQVHAQLQQLTRVLAGTPSSQQQQPVAVVVSSIAGGSGAGAVIDVCDMLRASGGAWASESIGFLYCPDVFDHLPAGRRAGVRPNALATLSELVAGYGNNAGPRPETVKLFNQQGLVLRDGTDRLGPKYPFLVGARNDAISYPTQNDIYQAMGRALSSWATSVSLQDQMDSYISANWMSTGTSLPDRLGLKIDGTPSPFSAAGAARVGLGRDRFSTFAAQRLARAAVEQVLFRHVVRPDVPGDDRPEGALAQEAADNAFAGFLAASRLQARGEDNPVLAALRPDTGERMRQLNAQLLAAVTANAPHKGYSVSDWKALIWGAVRDQLDQQQSAFDDDLQHRAAGWVRDIQQHLRERTAHTLAREGYLVTRLLLLQLADELTAARVELEQNAATHARHGENIEQQIDAELRSAGAKTLPAQHTQVAAAVKRGLGALHYRCEARLRQLAAALVPDLADNLLRPLALEVNRAGQALRAQAQPGAGRPSVVSGWPDSDEVPARLRPPANEFVLDTADGYGDTLRALVRASTGTDADADALAAAVRQVITGTDEADAGAQAQQLLAQNSAWLPKPVAVRIATSPARGSIALSLSVEDLLARAHAWLTRPGSPAGNHVTQGLDAYLHDDDVAPHEGPRRLEAFERMFTAAVDAAQPLVGVNRQALVAVHQRNEVEFDTFFSELPFAPSSPAADIVRRVLRSRGMWREDYEKMFVRSDRSRIDAFAVLQYPYEPAVFGSLMDPIAAEWKQRNATPVGRAEFWRWRRARNLPEFVPVAPAVRRAMVRGWFTASLLGQLRLDLGRQRASILLPTPHSGESVWAHFPHPLLAPGLHANHDFLPLVLESLPLALVLVCVDAKIAPVAGYQRLRALGTGGRPTVHGAAPDPGAYTAASAELAAWIDTGALPPEAAPIPEHAGEATDSADVRQKRIIDRLEELHDSYTGLFTGQRARSELAVARSFELAEDISAALQQLAAAIRAHTTTETGSDAWN